VNSKKKAFGAVDSNEQAKTDGGKMKRNMSKDTAKREAEIAATKEAAAKEAAAQEAAIKEAAAKDAAAKEAAVKEAEREAAAKEEAENAAAAMEKAKKEAAEAAAQEAAAAGKVEAPGKAAAEAAAEAKAASVKIVVQEMSNQMSSLKEELARIADSNDRASKEAVAATMRAQELALAPRPAQPGPMADEQTLRNKTVFAAHGTNDLPQSALVINVTPTDLQLVERTSGRVCQTYSWRDIIGSNTEGHLEDGHGDDMEAITLNLADGRKLELDCFSAAVVQAHISDGLWKYQNKHLGHWNTDEIYIWVREIGPSFSEFAEKLTHVGLDGSALLHMSAFELSNLVRLLKGLWPGPLDLSVDSCFFRVSLRRTLRF
jgi:hypothetical protein